MCYEVFACLELAAHHDKYIKENLIPANTAAPTLGVLSWRSHFIWHSNAVAPLASLWPKKIMCCSWRWGVVAPNPKDFGLFLAQVVWMIQPKMETSSHWQEFEVSQVQHLLCLPDEALCSLMKMATWPTSSMKRQLWQKMAVKKPSWKEFKRT